MGTSLRSRPTAWFIFASLTAVTVFGCSQDGGSSKNPVSPLPNLPTSTTMSGAFASPLTFGSVSLTIQTGTLAPSVPGQSPSSSIVVNGTIAPAGFSSVTLTGTYDPATKKLTASGPGYSLNGTVGMSGSIPVVDGGWSGPNGPGAFGCSASTPEHPAAAYFGSYANSSSVLRGTLEVLVADGAVRGFAFDTGGDIYPLHGSTNEGTISFQGSVQYSSEMFDYSSFNASGKIDPSGDGLGTWSMLTRLDPAGEGAWHLSKAP